jgi:hypothetical protein
VSQRDHAHASQHSYCQAWVSVDWHVLPCLHDKQAEYGTNPHFRRYRPRSESLRMGRIPTLAPQSWVDGQSHKGDRRVSARLETPRHNARYAKSVHFRSVRSHATHSYIYGVQGDQHGPACQSSGIPPSLKTHPTRTNAHSLPNRVCGRIGSLRDSGGWFEALND